MQRPDPAPPKPEKATKTSRVVRRAKSAVVMRGGSKSGNGGSRIVPRFRIFGSSAGGGADIGRGAATAEVRPRAAAIPRSVVVRVARGTRKYQLLRKFLKRFQFLSQNQNDKILLSLKTWQPL